MANSAAAVLVQLPHACLLVATPQRVALQWTPAGFVCADVAIEFGARVPSYTVTHQPSATFTRSSKGDQVTLEGSAGVQISSPTTFHPQYPYLRQALQVENYEGYQQWALGIQGTPCLRVFTLASPARLVADIAAT